MNWAEDAAYGRKRSCGAIVRAMSETNRDPARDATPLARDDAFTLYDLRVEVIATDRPMVCNHQAGDFFTLRGENLAFPAGQTFPLYPLAALLPAAAAQQLRRALQDLGGKIIQHSPVTGFETAGGKVTAVRTANATYGCDSVVVAAGPQIPQLMAQLGVNVPLAAARAEMIITEPAPMMPLGGVDGHKIYGRQTMRGNLAYGGGPHEWLDMDATGPAARPSTPLARNLAKRLAELLPKAAHLNVIRSWAGVIENSPDGRPIIDRLTSPDNVVVASMSSVGFGLSPASGHAIRDLVIDGKCSFANIDILKLSRFDNLESDWREKRGWMPIT